MQKPVKNTQARNRKNKHSCLRPYPTKDEQLSFEPEALLQIVKRSVGLTVTTAELLATEYRNDRMLYQIN